MWDQKTALIYFIQLTRKKKCFYFIECENEEIDLRVKRQREALVRIRQDSNSYSNFQQSSEVSETSLKHKRQHLTVKSARASKCPKTHAKSSSSQQRHRGDF